MKPTLCRKLAHRTEADALAYAARTVKYARMARVYRCELCRFWHVTTQEKREAQGSNDECRSILQVSHKESCDPVTHSAAIGYFPVTQ